MTENTCAQHYSDMTHHGKGVHAIWIGLLVLGYGHYMLTMNPMLNRSKSKVPCSKNTSLLIINYILSLNCWKITKKDVKTQSTTIHLLCPIFGVIHFLYPNLIWNVICIWLIGRMYDLLIVCLIDWMHGCLYCTVHFQPSGSDFPFFDSDFLLS